MAFGPDKQPLAADADQEIQDAGHQVQRQRRAGGGGAQHGGAHELDQTDQRHQRGVFQGGLPDVVDPGQGIPEQLRQGDAPQALAAVQADGAGGFELAGVDGLESAPENLDAVGPGNQGDGRNADQHGKDRAHQVVPFQPVGQVGGGADGAKEQQIDDEQFGDTAHDQGVQADDGTRQAAGAGFGGGAGDADGHAQGDAAHADEHRHGRATQQQIAPAGAQDVVQCLNHGINRKPQGGAGLMPPAALGSGRRPTGRPAVGSGITACRLRSWTDRHRTIWCWIL